jgi:cell division septation protein DedD
MATCANCANAAAYSYEPIPGDVSYFCEKHLPSFAKTPTFLGYVTDLTVVAAPVAESTDTPSEAPKPKAAKKTAPVEAPVETPAEAPAAEAAPTEAPAEAPSTEAAPVETK